jgi:hypothetical protein
MNKSNITCRRIQGFSEIMLGNESIQISVLPELGGKIWELWHKPSQTQWLWHNPHIELKSVRLGASYDDNWAGGWEELFPNDAPGEFMGDDLPDHGEWWSQPWQYQVSDSMRDRASIRLWRDGAVTGMQFEKLISIEDTAPRVSIGYRILNDTSRTRYFLFKQHLALAVSPFHRLQLPGGKVTPVDLTFSTLIRSNAVSVWPSAFGGNGELIDLSICPAAELCHREFIYVSELPEGWCGAWNSRNGATLRLHFPRNVFPFTWLFMTYGGWRDLYSVVFEPCTNMPKDLATAQSLGQCAVLHPQAELNCELHLDLS